MYKKIAVILLVIIVSFLVGCKSEDAVVTPKNNPPDAPNTPTPSNGALSVDKLVTFKWKCSDPDGDGLKYNLNWGYDTSVSNVVSDLTASTYSVIAPLNGGVAVYWKITAKDTQGASTEGPVWHFTTKH